MKIDKLIKRRFLELTEKAATVADTCDDNDISSKKFKEWATNCLSLLQRVFGENSIHYQNFYTHYQAFLGYDYEFEDCRGIFEAAKEDYEGGYLFSVRALTKAEVLEDVLEQASELLKAGYKDPACVLAGVALETTLKEICARVGTPHGKLDKMNVELCKEDVYNVAKQKQITAWADLRNKAAHGEWTAYNETDVKSFREGVVQFIADYL